MVEMSAKRYEVDPLVPIHIREMIKPLANEDVSLYTKPSQVVSQHEHGLKRLTC
jgi:hypothetical protein